MSDEEIPKEAPKLALILRVQEWAAWMPMNQDPVESRMLAVSGETGIELQVGERLTDLEVLPTDQTKNVPIEAENGNPAGYVQVKLIVFRATLARVGDNITIAQPPEDASKLIVPQQRKRRPS